MEEQITCLICGHTAVTLARHIKAVHGITADVYRQQYPGARIRSEACEARRKGALVRSHQEKPSKGRTKTVSCSACGGPFEVSAFSAKSGQLCPSCKSAEQELSCASKIEGEEYVSCLRCSYKAENLTSHIQNAHPEEVGTYPGQMLAFKSAIRDKTALKGRTLSEETKAKMSANAGRWAKGLTKETDARVALGAAKMKGRLPWSKGLTRETHPSLQSTSDNLRKWTGTARHWNNGLKKGLTDVDFTPYLDETGAIDRKTMADELHIGELTLSKYMDKLGLRLSRKYVVARSERATIRLEKEELLPFALGNGKIIVARAMAALGRDYKVIKRECERHGLPTYIARIRQTLCLNAIATALGGVEYQEEWESMAFTNPKSGRRFRYDGFFPSHSLIVEFHGYQHWTFPSVYIKREEIYFALQERDRIKENLIHQHPTLRYFLVREDEPYTDVEYLRHRLIEEGIFSP